MKKYYFWLLFFLFIVIFILYLPLFKSFFQHDEWMAFGDILSSKRNLVNIITWSFAPDKEHYTPIYNMIFLIYFRLLKFNFEIYALLSILSHLVIVYLVYIFTSKVFKVKILAIACAAFFGLNSSLYQANTWVWYETGFHYSTIFALLSLISFWNFFENGRLKSIYISLLLLVVSLLIREEAVGFFALYPLAIILFKKGKFKNKIVFFRPVLLVGLIYFLFRVSMFFIPSARELFPSVFNLQTPANIFFNTIAFPSKVLLQTVFPSRIGLFVSRWLTGLLPRDLTGLVGTTQFDVFVEQRTLQIFTLAIFMLVLWGLYRLWQQKRNVIWVKIVIFGFAFVVVNSFVYALSSGRLDLIVLVDSRNLYPTVIGTAIFLVSLSAVIFKKSPTKAVLCILPLILLHVFYLHKELVALSTTGSIRKAILYQVKNDYPKLPAKVVFYTESDSSYYGMPETEKILPFEFGLGRILLSWYESEENFPRIFFENRFLWGLTSEGYIGEGNRGFGYYRNMDKMVIAIKENRLSTDSILAYRFYSKENLLVNVSDEVRRAVELKLPPF
jgi:hypothetical protein